MPDAPTFPVIEGKIVEGYILRQHAASGSIGETEIEVSTTAGLGGCALVVEVAPPSGKRVYVVYDLAPHIEAVARAVLSAPETTDA